VPAGSLKQQNYAVELYGIPTGGVAEIVGSYSFGLVTQ
jgi:hypothetical protein